MVFGDPTLLQQLPQQKRGFLEFSRIAYVATQLFQGNPDIICAWSSMKYAVQYGDNTEDKQKICVGKAYTCLLSSGVWPLDTLTRVVEEEALPRKHHQLPPEQRRYPRTSDFES